MIEKHLNFINKPLLKLCQQLGGVHHVINLIEQLNTETQYFYLKKLQPVKPQDIEQFKYNGQLKRLKPHYYVWELVKPDAFNGRSLIKTVDLLDELEYSINHGVFVPENIYFSTIERIDLMRQRINQQKTSN